MPPRDSRRPLAALLALLVLFFCAFSAHDNDTWWHIRAGELIWTTHRIPSSDPFSWTIAGKPWFSFEWLSELLLFWAYRLGAVPAVEGLKLMAGAAAFLIAFASQPTTENALFLGLAAFCGEQALLERPGIFDLTLLAALMYLLPRAGRGGRFWAAPILIAVWVNLHGPAALIGLAAVVAACLDAEVPPGRRMSLLLPSSAALACNPHGLALLGHLWSTLSFPGRGAVSEWAPPANYLSLEGAFLAAGALAGVFELRKRPGRSLLLLALAALAAGARRHIPLYCLFAAPVLAGKAEGFFRGRLRARHLAVLFSALGWLWWDGLYLPWGRAFGFGSYEDLRGAAAFLNERGISGRMFNEYDSGGALIGLGFPARKVFVDSRNVEYGPELVGDALRWAEDWNALDAKYDFDYAVLFNRRTAYPCRKLDEDPAWALVYWDDAALVYVKKRPGGPEPLALLRPNETFLDWIDTEGSAARELTAELDRSLRLSGRCVEALLARAYLHALLKESGHAELLVKQARSRTFWKAEQWADLASVERALGRKDEAGRDLARALRAARQAGNGRLEVLLTERAAR